MQNLLAQVEIAPRCWHGGSLTRWQGNFDQK